MVSKLCETSLLSASSISEEAQQSPPTSNTAFTLSFGGVNFQLTPDSGNLEKARSNSAPLISVMPGAANGMVLNLASFTGTLCVTMDGSAMSATVEEEPESPVTTNFAAASTKVSPRQQLLPFVSNKGDSSNRRANAQSSATAATPITSHSRGLPLKPSKKDGDARQQKRSVPDIDPNPQPSPMPNKKSKRNTSAESLPDEPIPLGQISQLSCPSQSSVDIDGIDIMDTAPLSSSMNNASTSLLQDDVSAASSSVLDKEDSASLDEEDTIVATQEESVDAGGLALSAPLIATPSAPKGPPPPSPRWGHTMTAINGNRILVYGGQSIDRKAQKTKTLSDLHVYDVAKGTWYQPVNCEGVARQWHSATYLPDRNLLISFGGESPNPKTGKISTTDQVMVLDTEIMLWYPPSVSGTIPSGRSGHSATLLPNSNELVVFGGVKGSKWQNSVAVLDIARWKWSSPKICGDAPRPRSYHSATAVSGGQANRLVIFGGNGSTSSFNTIHVLETDGKKWMWSHPKATGALPSPRTGHCATLLDDNKSILIYGGWDPTADGDDDEEEEDTIFSDSFILDTETWTWSVGPWPVFSGDECVAANGGDKRVGHKSVLVNGKVLVFGGRIPNDDFAGDFQTLTVPEREVGLSG